MDQPSLDRNSLLKHSPSAGAMIFIALLTIVQFLFIVGLTISRRDGAHIVEASGAQRMRIQRIAFLALGARTGQAPADWRAEMDRTLKEFLEGNQLMLAHRDMWTSASKGTTETTLSRSVWRYARAAQQIEANAQDSAAFKYIVGNQKTLRDAIDVDVKSEAQSLETQNGQLVAGLSIALACILGTLTLAWTKVLAPHERFTTKLIMRLDTTNERLRSLLSNHSDGAATSDTKQINTALELVLKAFGMQFAYIGECDEKSIRIEHAVGEHLLDIGSVVKLEETHVREALALGDVLTINDLSIPERAKGGESRYPGWHGYISAPLFVNGRLYGAIGFLSKEIVEFNDLDRDYIRLVALLISSVLERRAHNGRLDQLAFYDILTSLPNRAKLMQDIDAAISLGQRHKRGFALHFIDLDGFKNVNDNLGHAVGDLALQEAANRLRSTVRGSDIAARLGGDEFVVLQTEVSQSDHAAMLANRIVAALSEPYILGPESVRLSASVGVAIFPKHGADSKTLLKSADSALYRAKANGKNRTEIAANNLS